MIEKRQLPSFITAEWYFDPTDHRCPHDAWLVALEISEPAEGERMETRRTTITLKLLGAYHDGLIIIRYKDVKRYSLTSNCCEIGLGDWLNDKMSVGENNTLIHHITWRGFSPTEVSHWTIEAADISYEWIPK